MRAVRRGYLAAFFMTNVLNEGAEAGIEHDFNPDATPQYKLKMKLTGKVPDSLHYRLKNHSILFA